MKLVFLQYGVIGIAAAPKQWTALIPLASIRLQISELADYSRISSHCRLCVARHSLSPSLRSFALPALALSAKMTAAVALKL